VSSEFLTSAVGVVCLFVIAWDMQRSQRKLRDQVRKTLEEAEKWSDRLNQLADELEQAIREEDDDTGRDREGDRGSR
jgi:hypothetical protein